MKIGGERSSLSRSDRQAAMSIVAMDKEEIAKTDADALLALRSDIEKVTLGTLIQKFEEMLAKNLSVPPLAPLTPHRLYNPFLLLPGTYAACAPVVPDAALVPGEVKR